MPFDSDLAIELLPDRPEAYLGRALVPGRALADRLAEERLAEGRAQTS